MGLLGKISRTLFGGSTSKSGNKNLGLINDTFGGAAGYTGQAGDAVSKFLGGDPSGFNAYKDATGFDFGAEQGSRGITGNAAARGLLRSGATSKALVRYGNDYSQQFAKDYLSQYLNLGQLGLGAGGLLASAGDFGKSSSTGGLAAFLGALLPKK